MDSDSLGQARASGNSLYVSAELEAPYTERYNREAYRFDSTAPLPVKVPGLNLHGGIQFAGVNGNPRTISPDKNNFGPRFGFAYRRRRPSSAAGSASSTRRSRSIRPSSASSAYSMR